jgi:hypothetical protein
MPEPMALTPADLTPQEQQEFDKLSAAQPQPLNPIRDLSAQELADLSVQDKDNFDLVNEFRNNQDLWKDPQTVQKVADAHNLIKQRGFKFSDLPGPAKVAGQVYDVAKGLVKQAWNYAGAGVNAAMGVVAPEGIEKELVSDAQQKVAENFSGTEQAVTGLSTMVQKGAKKLVSKLPGTKTPADFTPEEKLSDLWDAVGKGETEQDISKGHGAFMQAAGGNVISDLEKEGKGVRPEEVAQLAPGDPFSFWGFGKAMEAGGKVVSAATPKVVKGAISSAGQKIAEAVPKIAGKAIETSGDLTQMGAKAAEHSAKYVLPAAGFTTGLIKGGPVGALAGLKGGEIAAKTVAKGAKTAVEIGKNTSDIGQQISGVKPMVSPYAQLGKDVLESAPGAVADIGKGVATDIGVAAATSESPKDTESVGLGAAIGALHGAKRVGAHAVSGQIIAPRAWGSNANIPSSNNFPALNAMHTAAIAQATPGVAARLNAVRQFAAGAAPGTEVFLAPDSASLQKALETSGMSTDQAKTWADQEGFFTTSLPDASGTPRKVIIAKNVDAAPHEAYHAVQDVLGESGNRAVDEIVKKEYAGQWDKEGQRYAARLTGSPENWRESVLDFSGMGRSEAAEKLLQQHNGDKTAATNEWDARVALAKENNPLLSADEIQGKVWRDVLTPEETAAASDRYLARELAAENFDMVFKHGPEGKSLPEKLAKVVANLSASLGGNPLGDRQSEIGQITPTLGTVKAVKKTVAGVRPVIGPSVTTSVSPKPPTATSSTKDTEAEHAKKVAESAPAEPTIAGQKSPRELLGSIAEAISNESGIKINYLSAPDEPAAATSSNRDVRRDIIETYRTMPPASRALWEKNFFPDKVRKTKSGEFQIEGWSPEVFAANAHKLAKFLTDIKAEGESPFEVKNGSFTESGWKDLFDATQKFVRNQVGGRTGAGEELVVPKKLTEAGYFKPRVSGTPEGLDQRAADFVNMLFNFKLPETPRMTEGKIPLNIAGQDISEASKSGRVVEPVRPRGEYTKEPVAGRKILEVNPVRNEMEQRAENAGVKMPSFIEAIQKLNLSSIKEVEHTPEQPQFRGNTLTLSAGFQPAKYESKELGEPTPIVYRKGWLSPSGKFYELTPDNPTHEQFAELATDLEGRPALEAMYKAGWVRFTPLVEGAAVINNEFKTPNQTQRKILKQWAESDTGLTNIVFDNGQGFKDWWTRDEGITGQFQPPRPEVRKSGKEFVDKAAIKLKDKDETTFYGRAHFDAIDQAVNKGLLDYSDENVGQKYKAGFVTSTGRFVDREEAAKIAQSANQLSENSESVQTRPKSLEANLFDAERQFQPKSITEAMESLKDEAAWKEIRDFSGGKYGGGLTGWAAEQGASAKTPEDLAAFVSAHETFKTLSSEALKAKDYDKAMDYGARAQAASEAYQAATGDKPDGTPGGTVDWMRRNNPDYTPPLPGSTRQKLPSSGLDKGPNIGDNGSMIQAQPLRANDEIHTLAEEYAKDRGLNYTPSRKPAPVNEALAKRLADHYEAEKSNAADVEVKKSYEALTDETLAQYRAISNAGYDIEPWTGKGEPYANSADMVADIRDNQHLFYLPTKNAGKMDKGNPMLADSGINGAPVNDIFRAVHDFFGHAKEGYQFGPRGEFNAWRAHSEMYSDEAQGALAAETLAQNFWVNYGKHLRDTSGNIAVKGEKGYVSPSARPFAEQKNVVIPKNFLDEARGITQAQPKKDEQFKMPAGNTAGFKKAWITPDGMPVQLGSKFHHEYFQDPEIAKQYGLEGYNHDTPSVDEDIRAEALKKGFGRVNYSSRTGSLNVEARAADWPKLQVPVRKFAEANLGDIDNMTISLLDPKATHIVNHNHEKLFEFDDADKLSKVPLLNDTPAARKELPVAAEAETLRPDKSYNASDSYYKVQAQPNKKKQVALPGFEMPEILSNKEISDMTKDELKAHFPEAIVPKKRDERIQSKITESPLFKQAGSEDKAVEAFANKMVEFAKKWESHPVYKAGKQWYSEFAPMLKAEFGDDAPLMAELLAATSPQTNVETNYGYAMDALQGIKSGRFDKTISKFQQGLSMLEDERWLSWYNRELKAGNIPEPPANPTEAAFLEAWINKHDLKPRQSNGKLYGIHSIPVLQVFARRWLDLNAGPKTRNFLGNLLGTSQEATIDLWADRTMRRLGYEGSKDRWRILPGNVSPVSDEDFKFAQRVYRKAADELKMTPADLQGALWFSEKQHWTDQGWSRLDLGDFRKEMEKNAMLKSGYNQRLQTSTAKAKPESQLEILPRNLQ